MSADRRIAAFLTLADEELHAARILAGGAPRQAAYYIQQAAEKTARALLTAAGIPFGTGHNLGLMASALPAGHPLKQRFAVLIGTRARRPCIDTPLRPAGCRRYRTRRR